MKNATAETEMTPEAETTSAAGNRWTFTGDRTIRDVLIVISLIALLAEWKALMRMLSKF